MQKIPEKVLMPNYVQLLRNFGFHLINQGKTRAIFDIGKGKLLIVATDRISIFDFVLPFLVPLKGEFLTALTHFWFNGPLKNYPNHLENSEKYPGLNAIHDLKERLPNDFPLQRCLVVKKTDILPFELIYRHHIGGSVYKKYLETGMAGGQTIKPNLPKWSKLDEPLFTPSTKEEVGHDINVDAQYYYDNTGLEGKELAIMLNNAYKDAYKYAKERGILILDTKFEGKYLIADEILTPDSSRFVKKEDWEKSMEEETEPPFFDKQFVREWGMLIDTPFDVKGINKLDPTNPNHIKFVHNLSAPEKIIESTHKIYDTIFELLTGKKLHIYQRLDMGIPVE